MKAFSGLQVSVKAPSFTENRQKIAPLVLWITLRSLIPRPYICGSVPVVATIIAADTLRCIYDRDPTTSLKQRQRQTPGLMARKDDITGKGPVAGNHVSHANNKAKRRFELNVQKKRFFIPEENRWVTLKVSAKTLKTINKKGISAVLKDARANGMSV